MWLSGQGLDNTWDAYTGGPHHEDDVSVVGEQGFVICVCSMAWQFTLKPSNKSSSTCCIFNGGQQEPSTLLGPLILCPAPLFGITILNKMAYVASFIRRLSGTWWLLVHAHPWRPGNFKVFLKRIWRLNLLIGMILVEFSGSPEAT